MNGDESCLQLFDVLRRPFRFDPLQHTLQLERRMRAPINGLARQEFGGKYGIQRRFFHQGTAVDAEWRRSVESGYINIYVRGPQH